MSEDEELKKALKEIEKESDDENKSDGKKDINPTEDDYM